MEAIFAFEQQVLNAAAGVGIPHDQVLSPILFALTGYVLLVVIPRKSVAITSFVFALLYMSASHIYRMYTDWYGWTLDVTGPLMVMTIKISSLAFCYRDGGRSTASASTRVITDAGVAAAMKERLEFQIEHRPGLLEYMAHMLFFPNFLAGPAIEFREYSDYVHGRLYSAKRLPSTVLPTLRKLGEAVLCGALTMFSGRVPFGAVGDEAFVRSTTWYYKLVYVSVAGVFVRARYYFGWKLAEAAFVSSGLAWQGDRHPQQPWDRVLAVRALAVDLGQSVHCMTNNWNIPTNNWLKRYIYYRVREGHKPTLANMLAVSAVSAVWHGFYPGYYLFFVSIAFEIRHCVRPHVLALGPAAKRVYDVVGIVVTVTFANYISTPFVLLDFWSSVRFLRSMYFGPHVLVLATNFLLPLVLRPPRSTAPAGVQAPAVGAAATAAVSALPSAEEIQSELKQAAEALIEGASDAASGLAPLESQRSTPTRRRMRRDA